MEWSQVIAVVQNVDEPTLRSPVSAVAAPLPDGVAIEFATSGKEPVRTGGGGESVEADPFSQRL
ncbi:MAG: hypothetical protein GY720_12335 [bacterium]|nr:hypothetical protein [bacterium]